MKAFRRLEMLLPLRFNDGREVPYTSLADTMQEIRSRFGELSSESQTIHGVWHHGGEPYREDLVRVFVDVLDTPENLQFFRDLKERARQRFHQLDIWMTTHPIEVV